MAPRKVSIVAPVCNEVDGIEQFVEHVLCVVCDLPYKFTIILVDDGSIDGTAEVLDRLQAARPDDLTVLHLSRNFGHQAALTAGMDYADGDAVICMDADMQHPATLIPAMLERWRQGFDVVHTVRKETIEIPTGTGMGRGAFHRSGAPFKRRTAQAFYALINRVSSIPIQTNAADFRLLSRRVVEVFQRDLRERDRFVRGLVCWVGFRSCCIEFHAGPRIAGTTKYTLRKMISFARTGFVSFSKIPLKLASLLGLFVSVSGVLYGLFAVCAYVFFRSAVISGWTSVIVLVAFLGGCQLLFLGLLGEYVGTIFDEIKARPIYLIADERRATERLDVSGGE